jgi:hypothetical protein
MGDSEQTRESYLQSSRSQVQPCAYLQHEGYQDNRSVSGRCGVVWRNTLCARAWVWICRHSMSRGACARRLWCMSMVHIHGDAWGCEQTRDHRYKRSVSGAVLCTVSEVCVFVQVYGLDAVSTVKL